MRHIVLLTMMATALTACERAGDNQPPKAPAAVRYSQHIAAGGTQPPGATPANPHRLSDSSAVHAGAQLFDAMNCSGCHGGGAVGFVGPSLVDGRWRYGGSDAAVFQSIYYGRPKGMPAFGGMLGEDAIWQLVTYLKAQPVPATVPTESWVEEPVEH